MKNLPDRSNGSFSVDNLATACELDPPIESDLYSTAGYSRFSPQVFLHELLYSEREGGRVQQDLSLPRQVRYDAV